MFSLAQNLFAQHFEQGTVEAAATGADCLIKRAFEMKEKNLFYSPLLTQNIAHL